jgi:hypothetical protein
MVTVTYYDQDSNGDTSKYDSPWVAVYKDKYVDMKYLDHAFSFVKSCFEDAYNGGYISGWTVSKREVDWHPGCDSSDSIISQWTDIRESNGLTHEGVHVLINTCENDSDTALGTTDGSDGWVTDVSAHTVNKWDERGVDHTSASCVHEPFHSLIHHNCENVQSYMAKRDGSWEEHSLGVSKEKSSGLADTPFLGNDWPAKNGYCSNSDGAGPEETSDLSYCEKKGLRESAEHSAGFHDCSGCT